MSQEHWYYDDEREEIIDCTIPDGRSAAPSYPVCRLMNHHGMCRHELDDVGKRIAGLPDRERMCDELRDEVSRLRDELQWMADHYDPTAPEVAQRRVKAALLPNAQDDRRSASGPSPSLGGAP